ncbi:hypothetical protein [Rubidibacter lacunae]|nr:hypothetical protein [Rubidibacter lacunae]
MAEPLTDVFSGYPQDSRAIALRDRRDALPYNVRDRDMTFGYIYQQDTSTFNGDAIAPGTPPLMRSGYQIARLTSE